MTNRIAVWGYPGTGKTQIAKKYSNAVDFDEKPQSILEIKTTGRKLRDYAIKGKNILLQPFGYDSLTTDNPEELEGWELWFDFFLAYPSVECVGDFYKRYIDRGSDKTFAKHWAGNIEKTIEACEKFNTFKHNKIRLKPKQNLDMALKENGIWLQSKY